MLTELNTLAQSLAQTWLAFSVVLAVQIGLVLLLRKPVRARLGAVACYRLWLLPLLCLPFYLSGPALLEKLASLDYTAARNDSQSLTALQQFMDFELVSFDFDAGTVELSAGGGTAVNGWLVLILVWGAGTTALIAWHGRRWLDFSRQVHTLASPLSELERNNCGAAAHFASTVPALSLQGMSSAALFGVSKPVLLLPASFCQRYDDNQRHIILAHEAVHLRRGDNRWNLCALLLIALFWINPLVFFAWRRYRLDQELSCDAHALARCNKEQQKRYARTLLDSLGSLAPHTTLPALSAWDNLRDIKERSLMIKQHLLTKTRRVTVLCSLMLLAGFGAALTIVSAELVSPAANAAQADRSAMSTEVGRLLSDIIVQLNADNFDGAAAMLQPLLEPAWLETLTPFEKSRVFQIAFNLKMNAEDYPAAREQLQLAIDSGGLNAQEASMMRYQMAQLYVQEEKYAEAAAALEAWIAAEESPNSAAYYLLAASYYYQNLFDKALPNAQKAVDLAGEAPMEGWLSMLASLNIQLEDFDAAESVTARMVELFPDKDTYRRQLEELKLQNAQQ